MGASETIGHEVTTGIAGVLGLEPRLNEPESLVLPITPYPTDVSRAYLDVSAVQLSAFPGLPGNEKELYTAFPVDAKSIPNVSSIRTKRFAFQTIEPRANTSHTKTT